MPNVPVNDSESGLSARTGFRRPPHGLTLHFRVASSANHGYSNFRRALQRVPRGELVTWPHRTACGQGAALGLALSTPVLDPTGENPFLAGTPPFSAHVCRGPATCTLTTQQRTAMSSGHATALGSSSQAE